MSSLIGWEKSAWKPTCLETVLDVTRILTTDWLHRPGERKPRDHRLRLLSTCDAYCLIIITRRLVLPPSAVFHIGSCSYSVPVLVNYCVSTGNGQWPKWPNGRNGKNRKTEMTRKTGNDVTDFALVTYCIPPAFVQCGVESTFNQWTWKWSRAIFSVALCDT